MRAGGTPGSWEALPRGPPSSWPGSPEPPRESLCVAFAKMGFWLVFYYFAPEERLKDAEREMKIRKMGTGCSNRLGSASPPNEAIIHFPFGAGRAARLPVCRQRGLPTFPWINHASGPSQPAPTPPHALMTRTGEGSLATCDPGYGVCTGDVSIAAGHGQPQYTQ